LKSALFVFLISAALPLLSACSHTLYHPDVRAGETFNLVRLPTDDVDKAARKALSEADDYCGERHKETVVVKEGSKYTNTTMSESAYKALKAGTAAASSLGWDQMASASAGQRKQGRTISSDSKAANAAAGNGYTYFLQFKCR
jgi:hypothetical protein